MLQKRFVGVDGRLWVKRLGGGLWQASPASVFKSRHLYTYVDDDGGKLSFLEEKFAQLETAIDPIIKKVLDSVRASRFPTLSQEEWDTFLVFLIMQYRRVPKFIEQVVDKEREGALANMKTLVANANNLSQTEREELLNPSHIERSLKNAIILSQTRIRPSVWNIMSARGITIGRIQAPICQFILGSSPVARFRGHTSENLADPSVELWLPLAPDIAFCSTGFSEEKKLLIIAEKRHVRHINRQIAANSEIIASASRDLVVALMRRRRSPSK